MGKPHSYRKYKKALKNRNKELWEARKTKWPGNFHPKQAFNMLCLRPFYLPNENSFKMASIFDLTEAEFDALATPFLGVSCDKFELLVASQRR